MLQQASATQFTIGKLDAGMAILISTDHHMIEFPVSLLPENVQSGSIINVTIERNQDEELRKRTEFLALQEEIFNEFSQTPETPVIRVRNTTQTSVTIEWEALNLYSATLRSIDVYRNEQKLSLNVPLTARSVRLTGLDVAAEYQVKIVLRTSAGKYTSNLLSVKTHTLENLTGIHVCFGQFGKERDIDDLIMIVNRMGANYSEELSSDTTHLVATVAKGPKYEKALEMNIPIVTPEFLKTCEEQKKIQPVHSFYLPKNNEEEVEEEKKQE